MGEVNDMTDNELLQAIYKHMLGLKSDVLELKSNVTGIKGDMTELQSDMTELKGNTTDLKSDVKTLNDKIDSTKQELVARMDDMERDILNSCLGYTDEQDETIMKKIDNIQSTVNTATRLKTIDNDLYNLVNKRIDEVVERVEQLEKKIS